MAGQLTAQLQRTEEWTFSRLGRLTASDFGAALGLNPWCSRQELWRRLTGRAPAFEGNEATAWGEEHEKDAKHAFEVDTGLLVSPSPFLPYEDWSGCSPDGYIEWDGLVEFKCPHSQRVPDQIPEHYLAQVIGQLGITGRSFAYFCVWTPDDFRKWRVDANPKTWDRMEAALKDFWRYVRDDIEPKRAKKFNLEAQWQISSL